MCRVYNTKNSRLELWNLCSPHPYPLSRSRVSAAQSTYSSDLKLSHMKENEILGWVHFEVFWSKMYHFSRKMDFIIFFKKRWRLLWQAHNERWTYYFIFFFICQWKTFYPKIMLKIMVQQGHFFLQGHRTQLSRAQSIASSDFKFAHITQN